MEKGSFISDLQAGTDVTAVFVLASAQQGQAKNGPYWRLELRDSSGAIEGKIWFPQSQNYPDLQAGSIVQVSGRVGSYRERTEISVEALRPLSGEEKTSIPLGDLVHASPYRPEDMLEELKELCSSVFAHAPWRKFARALLKDEEILAGLLAAPAAVSMHHAYAGGLLEHTLSVCALCMLLADRYPELDRQTLLAGAVCHDLGKIWELSYGLNTEYTDAGRLIGHISIGLEKIEPHLRKCGLEPELAEHLKHLVLSHHGQREFGSPCLPSTAEAMVLHYADNIDAKMNQIATSLKDVTPGGQGWSPYVKGLDRALYRPLRTPEAQRTKKNAGPEQSGRAKGDNQNPAQAVQCSLLLKE